MRSAALTEFALPCKLCGGKLDTHWHEAFSTDSSFRYVGCSECDVSFGDEDTITQEVIDRWNKLMGTT